MFAHLCAKLGRKPENLFIKSGNSLIGLGKAEFILV
jgi:hypothetical protein